MLRCLLSPLVTVLALWAPSAAAAQPAGGSAGVVATEPILSGHSHNDYERDTPLWEALAQGLTSIEVDVHLIAGELLVAHDEEDVVQGRTLRSLYLEPLRAHVARRGGHVYRAGHTLDVLVDIKSGAEATYRALRRELSAYRSLLTVDSAGVTRAGALSVIVSGNRPRETMLAEQVRFATYDGRLDDLGVSLPAGFVRLVSDDWEEHFRWRGEGPFPEAEARTLRDLVARTHQAGYRLRFWGTPGPTDEASPTPSEVALLERVWTVLLDAGVDLVSVDVPARYAAFARTRSEQGRRP